MGGCSLWMGEYKFANVTQAEYLKALKRKQDREIKKGKRDGVGD